MNVRSFVALCGVVLGIWLAVTYVRPVSEKHYPLLGKKTGSEMAAQHHGPEQAALPAAKPGDAAEAPLVAGAH